MPKYRYTYPVRRATRFPGSVLQYWRTTSHADSVTGPRLVNAPIPHHIDPTIAEGNHGLGLLNEYVQSSNGPRRARQPLSAQQRNKKLLRIQVQAHSHSNPVLPVNHNSHHNPKLPLPLKIPLKGIHDDPTAKRHPCAVPGCPGTFSRFADMERHCATVHKHAAFHYHCLECGCLNRRLDKLREHWRKKHHDLKEPEGFERVTDNSWPYGCPIPNCSEIPRSIR